MLLSVLPLLACLGTVVLSLPGRDPWAGYDDDLQENYKHGRPGDELLSGKRFCSWKCLTFSLQWPGGFCLALEDTSVCSIPAYVNTWTIHGLWPLRAHYCCKCWTMFHSDVKELDPELSQMWPSLVQTKSSFQFWSQEWEKHGVCAACVEGLNSPLRYFSICLKLRAQLNVHRVLEDAGIKPSCNHTYKFDEVHRVLSPLLGDHHTIECVQDDEGREVWFQVKVPLSHNLTLGCEHQEDPGDPPQENTPFPGRSFSPGHPCPQHTPLYYLPIDHQKPQKPCA